MLTIQMLIFSVLTPLVYTVPTFEQRQVLATRGEQLAGDGTSSQNGECPTTYTKYSIAGTTLRQGEEETADEDITWNVEAYPPRPASE
jgi:hypothetical protein